MFTIILFKSFLFLSIILLFLLQSVTVNGITFEALNAGHVLGAAQFLIQVAGKHKETKTKKQKQRKQNKQNETINCFVDELFLLFFLSHSNDIICLNKLFCLFDLLFVLSNSLQSLCKHLCNEIILFICLSFNCNRCWCVVYNHLCNDSFSFISL
jgi:hypothetical protein